MIRDLNKGDLVYYTGNRVREIYEVKDTPTKRHPRYNLRALDKSSEYQVITLRLDEDDPTWDCIFLDPREALNDAKRRQREYEESIRQQLSKWAEQHVDTRENLIKTLYQSWVAVNSYMPPEDQKTARRQIVIERIRQFFDINVE